MPGDNKISSNAVVNQLPLDVLSEALWPCVIAHGSRSNASLVCKRFAEADRRNLSNECTRILKEAANNPQPLYRSICTLGVTHLKTCGGPYQFDQLIKKEIKTLSGGGVTIPERFLTAKDIQVISVAIQEKNGLRQDRALEKIWPRIADEILQSAPGVKLEPRWNASEIRNWMETHPQELLKVEYLNLNCLNLSILPSEIRLLKNLIGLSLSQNQLFGLPAFIGELTHLEVLDVSKNLLSELPAVTGSLKNLRQLIITENPIRECSEEPRPRKKVAPKQQNAPAQPKEASQAENPTTHLEAVSTQQSIDSYRAMITIVGLAILLAGFAILARQFLANEQ